MARLFCYVSLNMHVITNSDVMYSGRSIATGLPKHITEFCKEAAAAGGILVIPRTALLEIERHQDNLREETIGKLDDAVRILRQYNVAVQDVQSKELVKKVDVVKALAATGIRVQVEDARLEDFQDAERRASLHLCPHPPDTKTDEMRDLVIWNIAVRLAKKHGKAILISRDVVHSHERGTGEAEGAGLFRANDFDQALDFLGRETPSAKLVHAIAKIFWPTFHKAGLPVLPDVHIRRILTPEFALTVSGRPSATFTFLADGPEGEFEAKTHVRQVSAEQIYVKLENMTVNGAQWKEGKIEFKIDGELPKIAEPVAERLASLEEIIGKQ